MTHLVASGIGAMAFVLVFLLGRQIHPLALLVKDRRTLVSFGAGLSAAYVFVQVLPELAEARQTLTLGPEAPLHFEGLAIYFIALVGFLFFYGLAHFRTRLAQGAKDRRRSAYLQLAGFSAYVWLMAYLLADSPDNSVEATLLYALAIACHLLALDHDLEDELEELYDRKGRYFLAAAAFLGWAMGQAFSLSAGLVALLLAFISGAIVMNSALMELPSEKDGRFFPFLAGGLSYGLLLLSLD